MGVYNLILNKLTENNINNLILEFIDTIGLIDKIQFEEVQKVFYIKILTDKWLCHRFLG